MKYIAELNMEGTIVPLAFVPPTEILDDLDIKNDTEEIFNILLEEMEEAYSWDNIEEFNAFTSRWNIHPKQMYYIPSSEDQGPDDNWGAILHVHENKTYVVGCDDLNQALIRIYPDNNN